MIITVASGKGGTGKTTVAVSLALSMASDGEGAGEHTPLLLDCDVEAPNAALFLEEQLSSAVRETREVGQLIPQVIGEKCDYCGRCAEVCQYNAIAVVGQKVLVFPELCHGCGSCALNCPVEAIEEVLTPRDRLEPPPLMDDRAPPLQYLGDVFFCLRQALSASAPTDHRPIQNLRRNSLCFALHPKTRSLFPLLGSACRTPIC